MSRYGQISIHKSHDWSKIEADGMRITPYMQDLQLYAGQEDNFECAVASLSKYLRISSSSSQMVRLVHHYGSDLETESASIIADQIEQVPQVLEELEDSNESDKNNYAYCMMDGSMIFTREENEWKEIKLSRIFTSNSHYELSESRNWIRHSTYIAHLGTSNDFLKKLEPLVDSYEPLNEHLVFINDGARWIWNWIDECYPKSTQILDFFHAMEYLGDFASIWFKDKTMVKTWIEQQKNSLLNDKACQVISTIEQMESTTIKKQDAKNKILGYYRNHQHRMLYKTFKEKGVMIGSGPIESAHRNVIQKRMKQSGQRWSKNGAQNIANLRTLNLNNRWDLVIKKIEKRA